MTQATRCGARISTRLQNAWTCNPTQQRTLHISGKQCMRSNDTTSQNPAVSVTASNARLSKLGSKLSLMNPSAIPNSARERTRKRRQYIDRNIPVNNPLFRARFAADKLDNYTMKVGMIVERLPRYLNPPPSWQVKYENQLAAERQLRTPPVPQMLVPDVATETETEKQLVDIETEQDRNNDLRSLDRVQNDSLYLLVKQSSGQWTMPQQEYDISKQNEIRLDVAARRIVPSIMGDSLRVHTLGFAPVAMHRHEPTESSSSLPGTKLFLYHGVVVSGEVSLAGEFSDHVWVTKSQLAEYIQDSSLLSILQDVLITDSDLAEFDQKPSPKSRTSTQQQMHA